MRFELVNLKDAPDVPLAKAFEGTTVVRVQFGDVAEPLPFDGLKGLSLSKRLTGTVRST
jgi:hypothetical protein